MSKKKKKDTELASLSATKLLGDKKKTKEDYVRIAIEYFNKFQKRECVLTFETMLEHYKTFVKGRIIFSSILDRINQHERGCKVLEEGMINIDQQSELTERQRNQQFVLCIELGKLRLKMFDHYKTLKNPITRKLICLELSLKYFQGAMEWFDRRVIAIQYIAKVYEKMGMFEEANKYLEKLKEAGKDEYLNRYAQNLEAMNQKEQMIGTLRLIVEKDPQNSYAYEKLAGFNKDKQDKVILKKKAEFYHWVPKFCKKIKFSEDNYDIYVDIKNKNKPLLLFAQLKKKFTKDADETQKYSSINLQEFKKRFASLVADTSMISSEFLCAMIFNRATGSYAVKAFAELFKRCSDIKVQDLLFRMIKNSKCSNSVYKHAVIILSKKKYTKLFETILKRLPQDNSVFEMGIPEALANLGRARSVPHLIKVARIDMKLKHKNLPSGIGSLGDLRLRHRCLFALAYFKDKKAFKGLKRALKKKDLMLHATVALYRLVNDTKYLKPVWELVQKKKKYLGYDVFVFLRDHCKNVENLVKEIDQKYDEARVEEMENAKKCCVE